MKSLRPSVVQRKTLPVSSRSRPSSMSRAEFASRNIGKERPGRAVVRTAHVHLIPWGFATTELCGNALYPSAQQLSSMHQKGHCFSHLRRRSGRTCSGQAGCNAIDDVPVLPPRRVEAEHLISCEGMLSMYQSDQLLCQTNDKR